MNARVPSKESRTVYLTSASIRIAADAGSISINSLINFGCSQWQADCRDNIKYMYGVGYVAAMRVKVLCRYRATRAPGLKF